MRMFSRHEWMFLAFILIYSSVPSLAGTLRVIELLGGPAIVPENPRAIAYPLPIIVHALGSSLFCLIGALQFMPGMRRRWPGVHRKMGMAVMVAGCLSALTGLWMTHVFVFPRELQGALLYWVRLGVGLSMIGLITWAFVAVRFGMIAQHAAAMMRAYAIGQGASTQAVLGIAWMAVFGAEVMGPWRDVLMVSAWCINLLIAQFMISKLVTSRSPSNETSRYRNFGRQDVGAVR